jgi:hypothetical protein
VLTRLGLMDLGSDSRQVKRMRQRGDPVIGTNGKALRKAASTSGPPGRRFRAGGVVRRRVVD